MTQHSEGVVYGEFCALRTKKCKDKNKYRENCDPKPTGWSKVFFWEGSEYEDGSKTTQKKYFEAHHLLCVAAVNECIVGTKDARGGIGRIVNQTKWCINDKINMFAMPKWGHTIKYYCTIEHKKFFEADTPYFKRKKQQTPKFENIPQHDCDHDRYILEVKTELKKIANAIRNSKKKHEKKIEELKKKLNDLAKKFRGDLQDRGKGTHNAFQNAMKAWRKDEKAPSNWYKPFSMAKNSSTRTFPGIRRKIMERANSYLFSQ